MECFLYVALKVKLFGCAVEVWDYIIVQMIVLLE